MADSQGDACVMGREFLGQAWQYRVHQGDCNLRVNCSLEKTSHVDSVRLLFAPVLRRFCSRSGWKRASDPCERAAPQLLLTPPA